MLILSKALKNLKKTGDLKKFTKEMQKTKD